MSAIASTFDTLLDFLRAVDWDYVRARVRLAAVLTTLVVVAQSPGAVPLDDRGRTHAIIRDETFDFATWEASAVWEKTQANLVGAHRYVDEEGRSQFVRDYLDLINRLASIEGEIAHLYADPDLTDAEAASASLRAERDALRGQQAERQATAEAIIQSQIAATLVDLGFGIAGQIEPPVRFHFTQPPSLLVVSARDRIERTGSYSLRHDLTVDQLEALEDEVDRAMDVSSLSVPLGGLAVYPAMLIESGYAPHIFDIGAHEWSHHYLSFFPLGYNFGTSPDLYTMNETAASIVGEEAGRATLERYYPDLLPPPPAPPPDADGPPPPEPEPPAFDFRAEMHATRVRVDELLAEGRVEEAEAYMEERRAIFVENGHPIRKLNQAYFAFYGSYADQPGASGADPIGPLIRQIRDLSPSLRDFVVTLRPLTTREELESVLEEMRG